MTRANRKEQADTHQQPPKGAEQDQRPSWFEIVVVQPSMHLALLGAEPPQPAPAPEPTTRS